MHYTWVKFIKTLLTLLDATKSLVSAKLALKTRK